MVDRTREEILLSEKVHDLTEIALLSALITITGAIKLPSLLPGMEFQLSAPLAVAICVVFGFKKYILAGLLSSTAGLIFGNHQLCNVAIAMQFRLVVGAMIALFGRRLWVIALAGPMGTLVARLTLSFVVGKAAGALVLAALPGMLFTLLAAPVMVRVLKKVTAVRHALNA